MRPPDWLRITAKKGEPVSMELSVTVDTDDLFRGFMYAWFLFTRPTDTEWATDWYRDPGSAWWER